MIKTFCTKRWLLLVAIFCSSTAFAAEDYFKKYGGGGISVKVHYLKSAATKPMITPTATPIKERNAG